MTIHKSQGSEFEHTVMVLPTEPNPVLSRELVFTGVTRAKNQLSVFANEKIWQSAVRNTVKRQSGLGKSCELAHKTGNDRKHIISFFTPLFPVIIFLIHFVVLRYF